jgi:SAM-dependent methyltransferase
MLVLDVGCGTGVMACHLAASGAARVAYLGFDPDAEACAVARDVIAGLPQDAVRGEVQVAGIEDVARGRFAPADLVLVIRSLHECLEPSDPDSLAGVAVEISRLVSPGGRLLISEPVFADEASEEARDRIERYTRTIVGEPGKPHVQARAIRGAFEATGLRVESEHDGARFVLGRYLGLEQARQYTLLLGRG